MSGPSAHEAQVKALCRLLVDSGDLTPQGARILKGTLLAKPTNRIGPSEASEGPLERLTPPEVP